MPKKPTNVISLQDYQSRRRQVVRADQIRILAVDDRLTVRMIMQRLLENSGFAVTVAHSGREALEYLTNYQFSLLLLDLGMPDMDGLEVLGRIRRQYSMSQLPVIIVTASDADEDIERALTLGANDYIIKPIDYRLLHERIDGILGKK